ncbi:MAG: outer membrane protein assembly factor BamA [Spirochaetota bacterium]
MIIQTRHIVRTLCFTAVFISIIFASKQTSYTLPSQFKGKIVRKVEYIGLKRQEDGSYERIPIRNMDEKDLRAMCLTEEGYPLDPQVIAEDMHALFEEGEFLNIKVEVAEFQDGVRVRFLCEERPIIDQIDFRGIEELAETDLADTIQLQSGDAVRKDKIEHSLKLIREKYVEEGFFNVIVTYDIEEVDKENENLVALVFKIDEGEEIKIEKISLLGASKINDTRLRQVIESKEDSIFSEGMYNRATYEMDKQKILAYYRQEGYLDADIIEDTVSYEWVDPEKRQKRGIYITIKIHEGERYYFDKYTIEGNKVLPSELFFENFELRHQEVTPLTKFVKNAAGFFGIYLDDDTVCNDTLFQKDRYMIAFEYGKKGYLFTRVIPERNVTERTVVRDGRKVTRKYVHYHLQIAEGNKAYIENIIIKGNDKTKDKVIRRELLFKEGELYDAEKVNRTREVLFKLGYFSEVNIDIRPGSSNDKVNLIISVVEQNTGTLSLGGGYSSMSGFSIFASVGETNLLGYGYKINTKFEYGPLKTAFTVSFTDPWFLDYPVSFTTSIFYMLDTIQTTSIFPDSEEPATYQKESIGYSLGLGYRFWTYYTIGSIWNHSFKTYKNPTGNATEEIMRLEDIGTQEKRMVTMYGSYDTTDSELVPTKGVNTYLGVSFIGGMLLWGDDHYTKINPKIEWFKTPFHIPYLKDYPVVFQLRGSGTFLTPPMGDDIVRRNQSHGDNPWLEMEDQLYIGGPETVRGWNYYDYDLPESWRNRLYHQILYGAEVRIPIHPQYLWMAFFFDAGALYTDSYWDQYEEDFDTIRDDKQAGRLYDIKDIHESDPLKYFKYSYGFGFRVQIPMLPLRFWFGKKAVWKGFTDGGLDTISDYNFQVQIGDTRF